MRNDFEDLWIDFLGICLFRLPLAFSTFLAELWDSCADSHIKKGNECARSRGFLRTVLVFMSLNLQA